MKDFLIIENRKMLTHITEVEEFLDKDYKIVSSGQCWTHDIDVYWTHLLKEIPDEKLEVGWSKNDKLSMFRYRQNILGFKGEGLAMPYSKNLLTRQEVLTSLGLTEEDVK